MYIKKCAKFYRSTFFTCFFFNFNLLVKSRDEIKKCTPRTLAEEARCDSNGKRAIFFMLLSQKQEFKKKICFHGR